MPKPQQVHTVPNPGYLGLNTQDSPSQLPDGFAIISENTVIDRKGRVGSRKGIEYTTTTGGTGSSIRQIFEAEWADGTTTVFSVGSNKVYTGTTTLSDITGAAVITDSEWQIAQLQDRVYFFQEGHVPLQYDKAVGSLDEISAHGSYVGTVQQGTCVLSAFSRLWVAKGEKIYWSDLLNGVNWGGGTSGSIDMNTVFPGDVDTIVALSSHNNFLIAFGKRNIILFEGAASPATMRVQDIIKNIGCLYRDTVVNTGQDVMFLDRSGFRSLGRTIQEKSAPIGFVSRNVNRDLTDVMDAATATDNVKGVYCRDCNFILLLFPYANQAYCFDTQFPLETGALRATSWATTSPIYCGYENSSGMLIFGSTDGIQSYSGDFTDEGAAYRMRVYLPHSSLQSPHILKIGKELDVTTDGGNANEMTLYWAYDWATGYKASSSITINSSQAAEFGNGLFGVSEFGGKAGVFNVHSKMNGSGWNISFGWEVDINGAELAIQEINMHSVIGRTN